MGEPFYITTAISYPNGRPHIGHAYEAIAADVIARFRRARGRDVRLVTGTDEHGLKMVQTARAEGRDTLEYADEMSLYFKRMCDDLNISYDEFVRTTEKRHEAASVALWKALEANGDLYLDRYEGWYSVRDEAFYDESELSGEGDERRSPQGTPVEWTAEETWFFRLSAYQERLLAHYRDNPSFILPESRRNEVVRFVEGGLKDLSVSRTSFDWGVKVPGAPDHVMYVWVDALTTYMTGAGYPDTEGALYRRYWPADVHLIGKDIVRFHTVYWPAFLMSAGLPLPRQVFGHGFVLARGGEKMSKSLGNVVDPMALAATFGVDSLRYFLMREISFGQDGSYSAEAIVTRCNAELANSFGNLAQRVLSMIFKNLDGVIPAPGEDPRDRALIAEVESGCAALSREFDRMAFSQGLDAWMQAVFACNAYVDETAPWALRKTDPERMAAVLGTLVVAIRALAVAVEPVVPASAAKIVAMIDSGAGGAAIAQPVPVFPRLELEEQAA
jgi:methionyl-tRNA synthetase